MLSKTNKQNLKKINKMLKENFGVKKVIDSTSTKRDVMNMKKEAEKIKQSVMENAEFNTYHKNPEYNKSLLMLEACKIYMGEKNDPSIIDIVKVDSQKAPKKTVTENVTLNDKLEELKKLYENYIIKHGDDDKSEELKDRIKSLEKRVFENDLSHKFSVMLKEDAEKAETIMTAKGLLDDILGYQAKIGETQYKYLDPFIEMVREEYSAEMADEIREKLNSSLESLMDAVKQSKTDFTDVVSMLSGESPDDDMGADEDDISSLEDDDEVDVSDESDEESGDSEESDLDLDLDLGDEDEDESDESAEEEDFIRREE